MALLRTRVKNSKKKQGMGGVDLSDAALASARQDVTSIVNGMYGTAGTKIPAVAITDSGYGGADAIEQVRQQGKDSTISILNSLLHTNSNPALQSLGCNLVEAARLGLFNGRKDLASVAIMLKNNMAIRHNVMKHRGENVYQGIGGNTSFNAIMNGEAIKNDVTSGQAEMYTPAVIQHIALYSFLTNVGSEIVQYVAMPTVNARVLRVHPVADKAYVDKGIVKGKELSFEAVDKYTRAYAKQALVERAGVAGGTGTQLPIRPGTVTIFVKSGGSDIRVGQDDGNGNIKGYAGVNSDFAITSGSINYTTGVAAVTWAEANKVADDAASMEYIQDTQGTYDNTNLGRLDVDIRATDLRAQVYSLQLGFSRLASLTYSDLLGQDFGGLLRSFGEDILSRSFDEAVIKTLITAGISASGSNASAIDVSGVTGVDRRADAAWEFNIELAKIDDAIRKEYYHGYADALLTDAVTATLLTGDMGTYANNQHDTIKDANGIFKAGQTRTGVPRDVYVVPRQLLPVEAGQTGRVISVYRGNRGAADQAVVAGVYSTMYQSVPIEREFNNEQTIGVFGDVKTTELSKYTGKIDVKI